MNAGDSGEDGGSTGGGEAIAGRFTPISCDGGRARTVDRTRTKESHRKQYNTRVGENAAVDEREEDEQKALKTMEIKGAW